MKEHAKKALKHDVNVLGKTVPTMLIIGLFLVGGGSAAILSSFGTVSGEADVTQAIQIDNTDGQAQVGVFGASYGGTSSVVAGETTLDTFTVKNNMDEDHTLSYSSDLESDSFSSSPIESEVSQIDWTDSDDKQVGIDTTIGRYYSDAGATGADLDSYGAPSACDVTLGSIPSTLSGTTGVNGNDVTSGDIVCVQTGTYNDVNLDVDVSDVTLAGLGSTPSDTTLSAKASDGTGGNHKIVVVTSDGVTVTGFEITGVEGKDTTGDGTLDTTYPAFETAHTEGVTASYLKVHGNEGKQVVFTNGGGVEPIDATVKHVEAYDSTGGEDNEGPTTSETDGITFWQVDGGSISHVTAYNNGDNGVYFNGNDLTGTDIVSYNNGDQGVDISLGDQTLSPTDGPVTVTEVHSYDNGAAQIEVEKNGKKVNVSNAVVEGESTGLRFDEGSSEVEVRNSRFEGSGQDVVNDASGTLDANNNWFGANGIQQTGAQTSLTNSVSAGETVTVAVGNNFDMMMDGSDKFTLTTSVQ